MLETKINANNKHNFSEIIKLIVDEQLALDNYILKKINSPVENYLYKKILALQVEIGELANETRTFKYWSKKPSSERAIILDEVADCLHFLVSIGLSINFEFNRIKEHKPEIKEDLTLVFLNFFNLTSELAFEIKKIDTKNRQAKDLDKVNFIFLNLFNAFSVLLISLGLTWEDIFLSYQQKNKVNYQRQENNY